MVMYMYTQISHDVLETCELILLLVYFPVQVPWGMQRLNTMVSSLVLRRTKEEMGKELAQLKLTNKMVETHRIKLAEEENRVYQVLFREAR